MAGSECIPDHRAALLFGFVSCFAKVPLVSLVRRSLSVSVSFQEVSESLIDGHLVLYEGQALL